MSAETSLPPPDPSAPPSPIPFLRRVRVRGYKSIESCDVTLSPLTILVGRNASGKSNFIDALSFLRDLIALNLEEAVKRHGGRSMILCRTKKDETVEFEVEFLEYEAGIGLGTTTLHTKIFFPAELSPRIIGGRARFKCGDYWREVWSDGRHYHSHSSIAPDISKELGSHRWNRMSITPNEAECRRFGSIQHYNLQPTEIRRTQRPQPGYFLEFNGSNVASALETTRQCDPYAHDRIARYLNAITRNVELVGRAQYGQYETVDFRVIRENGPPLEFDAESMSDGTLRALGALTAVFQSVPDLGAPSLVAIEEPETALHPAAMRALVAAFDEATARTQIILTTHSPDLLDCAEIRPENIRVVEMIDGKTVIAPVDEVSIEVVKDGLSTWGGLARDRQLKVERPDTPEPVEMGATPE